MKNVEHYTLAHIIINIHHIFNTVLELLLLTRLKFCILQAWCAGVTELYITGFPLFLGAESRNLFNCSHSSGELHF